MQDIWISVKNRPYTSGVIALLLVALAIFATGTPRSTNTLSETKTRQTEPSTFSDLGNYEDSEIAGSTPSYGYDTTEEYADESSPSDKLIIKNGTLSMEVANLEDSVASITAIAESKGGYVVTSEISSNDYLPYYERSVLPYTTSRSAAITIRVPSEQFEAAMADIKNTSVEIFSERITGQDVTEEYTDLQAELRNLEAAETEFVRLLAQTDNVTEILQVQREITSIRGQIDVKKGRIKYLAESARLSSITVSLTETPEDAPIVEDEWSLGDTIKDATRDLVSFVQDAATSTVYAVIFYGPLAIVILLLVLGLKKVRHQKKQGNTSI